jgi:hypothetical protein
LTVVSDGIARFKMADNHPVNKQREEVDAYLASMFMDGNQRVTPYNPTVVNSGGKLSIIASPSPGSDAPMDRPPVWLPPGLHSVSPRSGPAGLCG